MAAHHNVNPNQLSMLEPAHKLFDIAPSLDTAGYEGGVSDMRRDKRKVNRVGGLPASIAQGGHPQARPDRSRRGQGSWLRRIRSSSWCPLLPSPTATTG